MACVPSFAGMSNLRNVGLSLLAAAALALPAAAKSKAKAEVTCVDGTTAKAGRGACSHHGGVAGTSSAKSAKKEKSSKKADEDATARKEKSGSGTSGKSGGILGGLFGRRSESAQGRGSTATPRSSTREKSDKPTARCKDGTMSSSAHRSGTCSGHGGVADWLDR